ncbi:MAG TPA: hypothetical protein VFR86_15980 [Burkholderiaceae bacterium]|nr:hypothetical protein [Burkholderiaceae bacterium]
MTMHATGSIEVGESNVRDWLVAAFAAERAPQRVYRKTISQAAQAKMPARGFYWWMLGLAVIALVLR